jgi:hypothetical protein
MINRRAFALWAASSALLRPLSVAAQISGRLPRIGVLGTTRTAATQALSDGLRDLGWIEGQTITIEWRWAMPSTRLSSSRWGLI